jgi:signal transduction histidine kinase
MHTDARQPIGDGDGVDANLDAPSAILRGSWLLAARVGWVAVATLTLGLATAGVVVAFDRPDLIRPPSVRASLAHAGLSNQVTIIGAFILPLGVSVATGLLIFWRRSDDAAAMLIALLLVLSAAIPMRTEWPLHRVLPWLQLPIRFLWVLAMFLWLIFLFVFPDGRFVPRWTRLLGAVAIPAALLVDVSHEQSKTSLGLTVLIWSVFWGIGLHAQAYRYRHVSGPVQRQQTKWVALAVGLAFLFLLLGIFLPTLFLGPTNPWSVWALALLLPVFLLIPASIAIAILRHHLYDIDRLISRTLTYGLLTVGGVGVYIGVVNGAEWLLREGVGWGGSLLATAVIAVGFAPARDRLQRWVDRRLYGDRHDPVRAMARLGERLRDAPSGVPGGDVLAGVLQGVCETLRLPSASLRVEDGVEVAAFGRPGTASESIPLEHEGQQVGVLLVGVRSGGDALGAADRQVLEVLAAPVAVALHAVLLSRELQRSRERLVAAREEERRRLRRDLHDGLGPILTAVTLKADAARSVLDTAPDRADALLAELRRDAKHAIGDLRRVIYDLRPAALDELGLLGALDEQVDRFTRQGLSITLHAPPTLPVLPAAVEVAAFRIVTEALTNIARHTQAHQVTITVAIDGDLRLDVQDDGAASTANGHRWRPGVGLQSMAERAAEVGGTLKAGPTPTGGRVHASLPLEPT